MSNRGLIAAVLQRLARVWNQPRRCPVQNPFESQPTFSGVHGLADRRLIEASLIHDRGEMLLDWHRAGQVEQARAGLPDVQELSRQLAGMFAGAANGYRQTAMIRFCRS